MKISIYLAILLSFFSMSMSWAQDDQTKVIAQAGTESEATYNDIKQTLGIVPTFLKNFPESGISGAWMDMKGIQLNANSAIPLKYKELIGLAVSAQVPCRYCVYFHTEAAKLNNATDMELKESVAISAVTRRWATFLNGTQVDEGKFKNEIGKMLKFANKKQNLQAMEEKPKMEEKTEELSLNTPQDAFKDMKNTFGFVPSFVKAYPESGIVGLWKEMKGVDMNPLTAIPAKYKHLIGLAVGAQIPCTYCVHYSTQSAIIQGATPAEINEAVAMGGITREWSTVLNGNNTDEKQFRNETGQILKFLKDKASKEVSSNN